MSLIGQAIQQNNLARVQRIVFHNVKFPHGFQPFMDAMVSTHLIKVDYKRVTTENRHLWDDSRKNGGVLFETTIHPHVVTEFAGTVIIEGVPEAIEQVKILLETHGVEYDGK